MFQKKNHFNLIYDRETVDRLHDGMLSLAKQDDSYAELLILFGQE